MNIGKIAFPVSARSRPLLIAISMALAVVPKAALAGEQPLYQEPPSWVESAPAVDVTKEIGASPLIIFDVQQRLERGVVWNYIDTAVRADTPDALTQLGTLKSSWSPDKGDLIIHRAEIWRAGQQISLLTSQRFTVLRREQQLERRELDGVLTATMPVSGLQVGDIVRVSMSVTVADQALAGNLQAATGVVRLPAQPVFARLRASWPDATPMRWQIGPGFDSSTVTARKSGGYRFVDVPVPFPKREEMPEDAPRRFTMPALFQVSTFTGWEDVSRVMAPLFATDGLIQPGSPLAKEVSAIIAASPDPGERTARALQLVQSKISYLLNGMNGGNYVPQPPAKTWELRYGDCKAKTLLLLAILREMKIEAEAVLATSSGGDVLPELLPAPGAFNHVLVRAVVDNQQLWLDGTDQGTRLADLQDTPRFFHVLPLRAAGTGLMPITFRANARPNYDVRLLVDERPGFDLPAIYDLSVTFRGAVASQRYTAWTQANGTDRRAQIFSTIKEYVGDSLMSEGSLKYDEAAGTATVIAKGLLDSQWAYQRGRQRHSINLLTSAFAPDRARPAWQNVAVSRDGPSSTVWNTTYLLPSNGSGVSVDGDAAISMDVAGAKLVRTASLENGQFSLIERADWTGRDIEPSQIASERAKSANLRAKIELIAPADAAFAWNSDEESARNALASIDAILARAAETWPEGLAAIHDVSAEARQKLLDWRGALSAITKAIEIEPSAERYLARSAIRSSLHDNVGMLKDAELALALAPADVSALVIKSNALRDLGRTDEAINFLETYLSQSTIDGKRRPEVIITIAEMKTSRGDVSSALNLIGDNLASNPGDPKLLNARCWVKALGQVELDTALRDCTKAIELSDEPAYVFDSRAMVYFRLGRMDDALADLEAALLSDPDLTPSSYMRGIVRTRMGSTEQGKKDINAAIERDPKVEQYYKRFNIVP